MPKTRVVEVDGDSFTIAKPTISAVEEFDAWQAGDKDGRAMDGPLDLVVSSLKRAGSTLTIEDLKGRLDMGQVFDLVAAIMDMMGLQRGAKGEAPGPSDGSASAGL